jgi:transcription termination factor NusB
MTERELSQNLLLAYIELKGAREALNTIMEFEKRIQNKEFIEVIKQVKPKLNYFIKIIDNTLLNSNNIKRQHWNEIEEECFKSLDLIDQHIKTL